MKSVIIVVIAFVLLVPVSSFAQESISLISVQTDDNHYDEGDVIVISGNISTIVGETPVTLQLFTEGNLVDIVQTVVAQDGTYSHTVLAEGPLWREQGEYLVRVSYGEGNIAETTFNFSPNTTSVYTTSNFEVDMGSYGTMDVEYSVDGAIIKNMIVDSETFGLTVQLGSMDDGTLTLNLPRELIGAQKQNGSDDTFIVLIDGIQVAYQESIVFSESRSITINFEQNDSDVEIIGTYLVGSGISNSPSTSFEFSEDETVVKSNPEPTKRLPGWVKNIFVWFAADQVSEDELLNAIEFLINEGTIKVGN